MLKGRPLLREDGVIVYRVYLERRKTFGIKFQEGAFGWAYDGVPVVGFVRFPGEIGELPFEKALVSGCEITFGAQPDFVAAHNACKTGDEIEFHFERGGPIPEPDHEAASGASNEGRLVLRKHLARVRDHRLARIVRERSQGVCALCDVDYKRLYCDHGESVIEAHHILPLAEGERRTALDDLIGVCSNCHKVIHRYICLNERECATPRQLKELVQVAS